MEQNPHDWIKACMTALKELLGKFPREYSTIGGIGVAGHMYGACCLDMAMYCVLAYYGTTLARTQKLLF